MLITFIRKKRPPCQNGCWSLVIKLFHSSISFVLLFISVNSVSQRLRYLTLLLLGHFKENFFEWRNDICFIAKHIICLLENYSRKQSEIMSQGLLAKFVICIITKFWLDLTHPYSVDMGWEMLLFELSFEDYILPMRLNSYSLAIVCVGLW